MHDVVFAIENGFVAHISAAICSLLVNNRNIQFKIHIINSDLGRNEFQKISELCASYGAELAEHRINADIFNGLVLSNHFKKENYYRLLIPSLIKSNRALYLDADVIVTASLLDLLNMDLQGYPLAAVADPTFVDHHSIFENGNVLCLNSGVLLFDLEMWRSNNITNAVIDYINKNPTKIQFVDQCGINAVLKGNWFEIDSSYNLQGGHLLHSQSLYKHGVAKIIHYTGSSKPWHLNNNHPFKSIYWKYRNKTTFSSMFPDDLSVIEILKHKRLKVFKPIWKVIKKVTLNPLISRLGYRKF